MSDVSNLTLRFDTEGDDAAIRSLKRVDSGVQDVGESSVTAGSKLKGMFAAFTGGFVAQLAVTGVRAVRDQIGNTITASSDLSETINKSNVVFGSSAKAIQAWSMQSAKAFGLSRQQALDTVSTYAAQAQAAGLSSEASVKFGQDLVGAAADLGSFWNFDPSQVAQDIQSGLAGESEPLRKYNIYLTEASVKAKAMELGLAGANGELTEGNKVLARQALIMDQLGPAAGDFLETSDGLANSQRILRANLTNLQATIGAKLLPVVTLLVAGMNGLFDGSVQLPGIFTAIADGVQAFAYSIWNVLGYLQSFYYAMRAAYGNTYAVKDLVEFLPPSLERFERGLLLIANAVGHVVRAFKGDGLSGVLEVLPRELDNVWTAIQQIAGGLADIALDFVFEIGTSAVHFAEGLLKTIWEHKGDVWSAVKAFVGWFVDVTPEVFSVVIDGAMSLAGDIADAAGNLWGWVKSKLFGTAAAEGATSGETATGGVPPISLGTVLLDGALKLAETIWEGAKGVAGWIRKTILGAWHGDPVDIGIVTLFTAPAIGGVLLAHKYNIGGWIWSQVKGTWDNRIHIGDVVLDATITAAANIAYSDFAQSVKDGAVTAFRNLTSIGGDIAGAIADQLTSLNWASWITTDSFNLGQDVGVAIHNAIARAGSIGVEIVSAVADLVKDADWSDVMTKIGEGIVSIAAAVPAVTAAVATALGSFLAGAISGIVFGEDADFNSIIDKIAAGIMTALSTAGDTITAIWDNFTYWLEQSITSDTFYSLGSTIANAIWEAIKTAAKGVFNIDELIALFKGGGESESGGSGGTGAGFEFISKMPEGLDSVGSKIESFASKVATHFDNIKTTTETNMTDAATAVSGFADNTGSAFQQVSSGIQRLVGEVQSGARNIASAFASLPGQLAAYGYNAVDAFARALWSGVAEATAAATAIAAAVDIAVAARLRIASPSRVMDEHGLNTVSPFLTRLRDGANEAGQILTGIGLPSGGNASAFGGSGVRGGGVINNYFVIESGAYVSGDAVREIQRQAAQGAAKIIDKRITNRRIQES